MPFRRITVAIAVALVSAALAAPTGATSLSGHATKIVPSRSIGAVAIGMTPAIVRRAGTVTFVQKNQGHLSQYGINHDLVVGFWVRHGSRQVRTLETGGHEYRTSRGIGAGSSRTAVRRAYPHLRCTKTACWAIKNHVETVYSLHHGRVVLIEISEQPAG